MNNNNNSSLNLNECRVLSLRQTRPRLWSHGGARVKRSIDCCKWFIVAGLPYSREEGLARVFAYPGGDG